MDPFADPSTASTAFEAGASSSTVGRFPNTFDMYFTKLRGLGSSVCHLKEANDQPLFAVTFQLNWRLTGGVTLHEGPDEKSPALATSVGESPMRYWQSTMKILSPPAPEAVTERLRYELHLKVPSFHFITTTSSEPNSLPERFEWRHTFGDDVKYGHTVSWGWKLVRLGSDKNGTAGDGKEVVAAFTDIGRVKTKIGIFKFLSSGATGELGDAWAILAVLSALRIWQLRWWFRAT